MKSFNCLQHVFVFLGQVDTVPTTGTCMRGDGRGYRGTVTVTQSWVPCQSWNSQSPHQHPMAPGLFISDLDDRYNPHHGYCRNPGGLGRRPWCYTTKTTLRWEYCNITKCGKCDLFFDMMSVFRQCIFVGVVGYVAWILFSSRFALLATLALIMVYRFATIEMIVVIPVVLEFCHVSILRARGKFHLLVYTVCGTAVFLN